MTHERLDEAIERVAEALTTVGRDAALVERVRQRLHSPTPSFARPALAVAVALVAVLVWFLQPVRQPAFPQSEALAVRVVMPFVPLRDPSGNERSAVAPSRRTPVFQGDVLADARAPEEPINPGDGTAPLVVAEVRVMALSSPDVVHVAPLEVAPLDVEQLAMSETLETKKEM